MPIVDVSLVVEQSESLPTDLAKTIADRLGAALGAPPGRLWVRLHAIAATHYAENDAELSTRELPVFVTILHATPPVGSALEEECLLLCRTVAAVVGREPARVHVEYVAPGTGRVAFGGVLVR